MDYINIPCPKCFNLQMLSVHGAYICVVPDCTFCCTEPEYEDIYGRKLNHVDNIDSVARAQNCEISDIKKDSLDGVFELNLVDVGVSSDYTINKTVNTNQIYENVEIIDLTDDIINLSAFENLFPEEFQILELKKDNKVTRSKRKTFKKKQYPNFIDTSCRQNFTNPLDKLSFSFWKFDNKIFNWLRMPYFFKTHSKIVRILLLHLNVFKFKEHQLVDELKNEYSICETLTNQFRIDRIKPLCYHFLQKLYEFVDKIPNRVLVDKEMDERVLCLLKVLFAANDPSSRLELDCTIKISCSACNDSKVCKYKDYFLTIDRPSTLTKSYKNKLNYNVRCMKCKKKASKTIMFDKLPQFVILHCPKGLKDDINRYDGLIDSTGDEKLSVVGVVEVGSKYPFAEWPENPMSQMSYDLNPTTMDTRARPSYCVHFRNSNGWYSLNGYKPFLCPPNDSLSVSSLSDVRFIILGTVSNHREYRNQFSIEEFIKKHETITRKNYEGCFKKLVPISLSNKLNADQKAQKRKYERKPPGHVYPKHQKRNIKKINTDLAFETEIPPRFSGRLEAPRTDVSNNNVDKRILSASNTSSGVSSSSSLFGRNVLPLAVDNHENYMHLTIMSKNKVPSMSIDDYISKTKAKRKTCI